MNLDIFHNQTNGKGWAIGYEPAAIGYRARTFRHFDIRDLFVRNLYKERRATKRYVLDKDGRLPK